MKHDKSTYKTWFFDCDGVLLDSNRIKSEGMSEVAAYFSPNMVGDFVQYHQKNAGVSRFVKFDYFFSTMLERKDYRQDFDMAVRLFADYCFEKMMICDLSPGLVKWLRALPLDSKKYIISGGLQSELHEIFRLRNLDSYFDGIYGSPMSKEENLSHVDQSLSPKRPALFVGDSLHDYEVAKKFSFDFIFVSAWSDFSEWEAYFADKDVTTISFVTKL